MSGFAPGDVVVCVDDSPCLCCGLDIPHLVWGQYYRIVRIGRGFNARDRITIDGIDCGLFTPFGDHLGYLPDDRLWNIERFRKIDPASDEFTQRMRALRPHKVGEPA